MQIEELQEQVDSIPDGGVGGARKKVCPSAAAPREASAHLLQQTLKSAIMASVSDLPNTSCFLCRAC